MEGIGGFAFREAGEDYQGIRDGGAGVVPAMVELRGEEKAIPGLQFVPLAFHQVLQLSPQTIDEFVTSMDYGVRPAGRAGFQSEHERFDAAGELLAAQTFPNAVGEGNTGATIGLYEQHILLFRAGSEEFGNRNAEGVGKLVKGANRGGRVATLDHAQGIGGEAAPGCEAAHGGAAGLAQLPEATANIYGDGFMLSLHGRQAVYAGYNGD